MLQRLIPILQVHRGELCKTVRFRPRYYLGDPVNSVRVFNLKGIDELVIVDIDATQTGVINFDLVKRLGTQSFMPLSYGGGIHRPEQIDRLFDLGIDKVVIGTAARTNPELLEQTARKYGDQALIVSIDVRTSMLRPEPAVYHRGGRRRLKGRTPLQFAQEVLTRGAGEILLQDIDRDGTMSGLNRPLIREFSQSLRVPVIAAGGARDWNEMLQVLEQDGASAAASGTQFSFYGPYHAVLQNYPERV